MSSSDTESMNQPNAKHMLARIVMDAVAAGSRLPAGEQTALARELAQAATKRDQDPWKTSGGLRSGS